MDNKKNSNKQSEIDFVGNSAFQRSIKKSKWKQIILYILISIITVIVCMVSIHNGSQYLINKKIQQESNQQAVNFFQGKGAAISSGGTRYYYNLFSAIGKTTYYKKIGNKKIVWDTVTKEYPAIGNVQIIDRGSGMTEINAMNKDAHRVVRYNQLNNERIIDFYYPDVSYDYLPHELDIATSLDDNKLIEIALSFNKMMTANDLGEVLGYKNVDWLWVNSTTKKQMKQLEEMQTDSLKVKNGEDAQGYRVSEGFQYAETSNKTFSGAVVSGTPQELERFQKLDIVRASVIGATIDKY